MRAIIKKRLNNCLNELKLKKLLGSANRCPKCGMIGVFGSIVNHEVEDGSVLICGWCYKISKVIKC